MAQKVKIEDVLKAARIRSEKKAEIAALIKQGESECEASHIEKGIEYFKEAYVLQKALYEKEGNKSELTNFLKKMGELHYAFGKTQEGVAYLNEALGYINKEDDDAERADIFGFISAIYLKEEHFDEALSSMQQRLALLQKLHPENDHQDNAICIHNIGMTLYRAGKAEESVEYFSKALEIGKKSYLENDIFFSVNYERIGNVYKYLKNTEKALEYYEKALKIAYASHEGENNHPDIAYYLNLICTTHHAASSYEKALDYCLKSLEIRNNILPEHDLLIKESIGNIIVLYTELGETSQAEAFRVLLIADEPEVSPTFSQEPVTLTQDYT